jgi:hypothetical protein
MEVITAIARSQNVAGRFGSRATASKSITPSNAPLLRIQSLTALAFLLLVCVVAFLDRRPLNCRAVASQNSISAIFF